MSTPFHFLRVDLVSDTATRPTRAMRMAMAQAEVGDEQRGEDPTVHALEQKVAKLLGMPAAVFVPSATMSNQIALQLLCRAGDEVICDRTAHVINHEGGGMAAHARAQCRPLDTASGIFTAEQLTSALRPDVAVYPKTAVVVVENTSNGGGGTPWTLQETQAVLNVARQNNMLCHLDGARLMNASISLGVSPAELCRGFDTVTLCLSKGLGCPMGAVLGLKWELEKQARRIKQRMGGALRQAGILAAAGIFALDNHVDIMRQDHQRAKQLAQTLSTLPRVEVEPVKSNMVFFRVGHKVEDATAFLQALEARGVRMGLAATGAGVNRVRACLHLDVNDESLAIVQEACTSVLRSM